MDSMPSRTRTALITGIGGQDGSYLAELLLAKGYRVCGIIRRSSYPHTERIDHLLANIDDRDPSAPLRLFYGDLNDAASIRRTLDVIEPDEIYSLGAQSHVGISFELAESTLDVNVLGPCRLLEAIKAHGARVRFYQASSSEMFGASPPPQSEDTPFLPQSPYGVSKVAAFHLTRLYREAFGLHACNGILFNHESPRRGVNFVTRKITRAVAAIVRGQQSSLKLGNLDAKRDWGFAGDYVEAIWRIVQHPVADDFVVATGEMYTVREFVSKVFALVGLEWTDFCEVDQRQFRPAEVPALQGDASKARQALGWAPRVGFDELCRMMLEHDLKAINLTLDEAKHLALSLHPPKTITGYRSEVVS